MKRREKGLTLVELMVTLAVAIVILAIGIPAFNAMSARDISAATVNSLVTALQQARTEAISRGVGVAVQAESSSWQNGWFTCCDAAGNRLRTFAAPRPQVAITGVAGGTVIQFGSMGQRLLPDPAGTPLVTFTATAYSDSGKTKCVKVTNVRVTSVGQVRSENGTCP
jgi:type IV fimbrial biogenesis protein FimT